MEYFESLAKFPSHDYTLVKPPHQLKSLNAYYCNPLRLRPLRIICHDD
jgi:hypothetical protein